MILHSSLAAASAEAHRHDLLTAAERYRTGKAVRAWRRAATLLRPDPLPPPPSGAREEITDENRRYAVSR